jgi:perosamine synthetase
MNFFTTNVSSKSIQNVVECLKSTNISAGNFAEKFEFEIKKLLDIKNVLTVNSGTSALHLGLEMMGLSPGDEVILPPQTFIASGLAILMSGAKPVFADIDYATGNISTNSIISKITSKTKAIMPVHWAGYPCDLDEINKIAKKFNLFVIEDATHAFGALYKNKYIGAISDFTAFSFQAIKTITTADGGALVCKDLLHYNEAKKMRWFGIDRENDHPSELGERVYDLKRIGYKYHLNDFSAALGLGNLTEFNNRINRVREIALKYNQNLQNINGLSLLKYKNDRLSSYWLYTVLVENRSDFIKKMKEKKIPVSVVHQRIDKYSVFGGINKNLTNQEKFDNMQIAIPIHADLSNEEINTIIETIKKGW